MSRKRKRKKKFNLVSRVERAQRELAKGNAKTALKDAILCHREEPSPEHRRLLEEAYAGRVEQLGRQKMLSEASDVLDRLIDLDPVIPEIRNRIPCLQVLIGHSVADPDALFEKDPALLVEQADRCLLDTSDAVPDYADLPYHLQSVRESLALVEQGDDEKASESLQAVPRSSPMGDWKLFIRGLSAFYQVGRAVGAEGAGSKGMGPEADSEGMGQEDRRRMEANWGRLDPERPAYRIAQTLLVAGGEPKRDDSPFDLSGSLKRLRAQLQGDPTAELLGRIADRWRKGDLPGFFSSLQRFQNHHAETHAMVLEKIVEIVWKRATEMGDHSLPPALPGAITGPSSFAGARNI